MTRAILDIDILRGPDDVLADGISARLNIKTMTAVERRTALDGLIRHTIVDTAGPVNDGECGWCSTRHQLAALPDGARRLPQFSRLMASAAGRRAVGEPCGRCTKTALDVVKRRVRRPTSTGGATRGSTTSTLAGGAMTAHHANRVASPATRNKPHDPFGTCAICHEYRGTHPDATALTAGAMPEGCPGHVWNEPPPRRRPMWDGWH